MELARDEIGAAGGEKHVRYYNGLTGAGLPLNCACCAAQVTWVMRHAGVPANGVPEYKGCAAASAWFAAQVARNLHKSLKNNAGDGSCKLGMRVIP